MSTETPHEYPPEVIIRQLREHAENQDKVITCQDDEITAQNREIQRLRETIQKQEDKINRLCIVAYYHKDDTFAVKADFRCSLMALKSHKLEMLKVIQGSLWDQLCKAVGAPDRNPMP